MTWVKAQEQDKAYSVQGNIAYNLSTDEFLRNGK